MTFKKTLILAAIAAALPLAACSKAPSGDSPAVKAMTDTMPVMEAKANAVLIYADWCSSCKVLDPKLNAAKPMFDGRGINFVTLDYTAKDKADLMAQAQAAGVAPAISEALGNRVKTGQVIIVSADGERVLSKVNMTHTTEQIAEKFKAAISAG